MSLESHYAVVVDRSGEHPTVTITAHGIQHVTGYVVAEPVNAMRLGAAVAYGTLDDLGREDYTDPPDDLSSPARLT